MALQGIVVLSMRCLATLENHVGDQVSIALIQFASKLCCAIAIRCFVLFKVVIKPMTIRRQVGVAMDSLRFESS